MAMNQLGSVTPNSRSRPFVKWAGGKGQLLIQLGALFPPKFKAYHEPFLGGGAVFFHLNPRVAFLSDKNEELINAFVVVRDHVDALIESLRKHENEREYYYQMRRLDPLTLPAIERASRFIYLNKTCYNGLYRVNSKGQFNVPFGRYKNPKYADEETLQAASRTLMQAHAIEVADFGKVLCRAKKGHFVYFDPPYQPVSETSKFTSYTAENFDHSQQQRLAEVFRELDGRGCLVMLSNSNSNLIEELYRGYRIERVMAKRFINCDKDKRGDIEELVVLNYE